MFDQLLVGVQCHPSNLIWGGEEDKVIQVRKSLTLLTYGCKLTNNCSPQEPLTEWMRTVDIFLDTIMVLKPFSTMKTIFITC